MFGEKKDRPVSEAFVGDPNGPILSHREQPRDDGKVDLWQRVWVGEAWCLDVGSPNLRQRREDLLR